MTEENNKNDQSLSEEKDILELEKKCDEYLNNWKRARADFENYKKGETERIGEMIKYEREAMILGILQVLDSIYLAEKHLPSSIKREQWVQGFYNIKKQMEDLLKKEDVERIDIENNSFDPNTMEIVEEVDGGESGKISEEIQKGYIMNGKVIRPAKIKINK